MYRGVGEELLLTVTNRDTPPPSLEQATAYATALPCNALLPSESPVGPCLDKNWVPAVAGCTFGLPRPAGVSEATWKAFCQHVTTCKLSVMPGCPSFDEASLADLPTCLDSKWRGVLDYCDAHPFSDGPDANLNAACFVGGKAPKFTYAVRNTKRCFPTGFALATAALLGGIFFLTR